MNTNGTTPANSPHHLTLSVIIPVYNVINTLSEQLEALKAQEYDGDWEIIVVDNRSTDTTVDLVRDYQSSMPHLRLVYALEKQSAYYARNVGTQAARGDAFIYCDADDIVSSGWLKAFAKALQKHDLVAGILNVDTLNQSAPCRAAPSTGAKRPVMDFLPYVIGCNMAVSREAFEAVNGYSEQFLSSGDVDLTWRLQLHGYTIHDAPALVHYRYRDTLWALWKQYVKYGYYNTLVYRHFAVYGMPRPSTRYVLRQYKKLIKQGIRFLLGRVTPQERSVWLSKVALRWGRILGSLRHRTFYL